MSAPAEPVRLVCPKCGSEDILSWEMVGMAFYGMRFFQNPDDASDVIVDYDGVYDSKSADDGGGFEDDIKCQGCDAQLGTADLVPDGTTPNPDWAPTPAAPPLESAVRKQLLIDDALHIITLCQAVETAAEGDSNDAEIDAANTLAESAVVFAQRVIKMLEES